jgi:sterol desaturase/sphingolipid hydroxylase (fatty acid hydroxylase superfamily)
MFEKLYQFYDFYSYFVVTYFINVFVHYIIDVSYYDVSSRYKINPLPKSELMRLYQTYLPVVVKNVIISPIPFGVIAVQLVNLDSLYTAEFHITECILELVFTAIITEILFYSFHRIVHIPFLYKRFHKMHHSVKIPVSVATLYVDQWDMLFSNSIPLVFPAFFICSTTITSKIWFIFILTESILSHAGYKYLSEAHNKHHTDNNINYGNNLFMDRLFGTYG